MFRCQGRSLKASEKFNKIIYGNHPYGDIYPTEEMLDSYTIDDVRKFYSDNFGAQRTVVYVAGVFNEAEMKEAITKAFSEWVLSPAVSFDVP